MIFTYIVLLFLCNSAYADEAYFSYGGGVIESAPNYFPETKILEVGYRKTLEKSVYLNVESGYWIDSSGQPNALNSGFLSVGPGLLFDFSVFEIRNSIGLAAITTPDQYLGGVFPEFHEELYMGVRDKNNLGIGVKMQHFSSAGIFTPNVGRDFMLIELNTRF